MHNRPTDTQTPLLSDAKQNQAKQNQVLQNQDLEANDEVQSLEITHQTWSRKKKALFFSAMILGAAGLGTGAYFLYEHFSKSHDGNSPIEPARPLTFCPNFTNFTHSNYPNMTVFQYNSMVGNVITSPDLLLKTDCTINTHLEEIYENAPYGLIYTVLNANYTVAIFKVLGMNNDEIRERAFKFNDVSGYYPAGYLAKLPNSNAEEIICVYNGIYAFAESDPAFITRSCENIFMIVCRTAEKSLCTQLETFYASNEKLLELAKIKPQPTAYPIKASADKNSQRAFEEEYREEVRDDKKLEKVSKTSATHRFMKPVKSENTKKSLERISSVAFRK